MRYRSLLIAPCALFALAACGGDDEPAAGDTLPSSAESTSATDSATSVSSDAVSTEPAPPTTSAPATTDAPATTTAVTTTPPAPAGDAECLIGEWGADAAAIQAMADSLAVPMSLTIGPDSNFSTTFDGTHFTVDSNVQFGADVTIGADTISMSTSAAYHFDGTYTTEGDVIRADTINESGEAGDWSASVNGVEVVLPDGMDMPDTPPIGDTDFDGSTYTCTDTTLTFDVGVDAVPLLVYTRVA